MEKMPESLSGIQLFSLVGRQGAGKTTLGQILAERYNCPHIEASSVVKSVCGDMPRSLMPKTNERTVTDPTWLGDAIAKYALTSFPHLGDRLVLTGARELEVHDTLRDNWGAEINAVVIYCPTPVRLERQLAAKKATSISQFFAQDIGEAKIGLDKMVPLYPSVLCSDKTKPTRVVDQIIELLESTGAV